MNIEDEWITKIENNNEPIIIESEEMEDDDWVEDIEEEDKEDVKEDVKEDKDPITIEQMKDAIDESKKIILYFIKNNFGEDIYTQAVKLLNSTNFDIDSDEKTAELCWAYCNPVNGISLTEKYCRNSKNTIGMIHTIIHECGHAFSYNLSKGQYVNDVIDEAFANIFGEICINYYVQQGNKINYISEKDNDELLKNGYHENDTYVAEGNFVSPIMYALKKEGRDIEALKEYYCVNKDGFVDICELVLGYELRELLEYDLANVQLRVGVDNTENFMPQAVAKIRNIFADYLNEPLEEKEFKTEMGKTLYSLDKLLMQVIASESRLKYKILNKINSRDGHDVDFDSIFSKFTIEDFQQISFDETLFARYGFSDFSIKFIKGLYNATQNNQKEFKQILSLIGGYLPFDICIDIIQQQKLNNIDDILQLFAKYNVLSDEDNYINIIDYINSKLNNRVSKAQLSEDYNNKDESMVFLNQNFLNGLSSINLSNEQLIKIMYLYSNPISKINNENIMDIIDVLNNINYSELSKDVIEQLNAISFDLAVCICDKVQKEEIDLGVLIAAHKLPCGIGDEIYDNLIFENDGKILIFDKSKEAVEFLKKLGLQITNEKEVLDLIQAEEYKEIQFEPGLNTNSLYAFMADTNKTKILLNAYINQFLETTDPDFLNNQESLNTLLMLLDVSNQNSLGMSDSTKKRICSMIENKVNTSETILDENRNLLNRELRKNYRVQEGTQKLSEFFKRVKDRKTVVVFEPIMDYLITSGANSYQADSIISFYNTKIRNEMEGDKNVKYDLKTINFILNLVKNCNLDISSDEYNSGASQFVDELINKARTVKIDDNNIEVLREIYRKLQDINGLDKEEIKEKLFENEDIMNRICANSTLLDSAVQATTELTREGSITNQSQQIINEVEQQNNIEHQEDKEYNNG